MPKDIMVDLETLGVDHFDVGILSIGAVRFDPLADSVTIPKPFEIFNGRVRDTFFAVIRGQDACAGRVEPGTFKWWCDPAQSEPRRYTFLGDVGASRGSEMLGDAIRRFFCWCDLSAEGTPEWVAEHRGDKIWSHGLNFDVPILRTWSEKLGIPWPFHYRAQRDTRTAEEFSPISVEDANNSIAKPPEFIAHHPTWDAWLQARRIQELSRHRRLVK